MSSNSLTPSTSTSGIPPVETAASSTAASLTSSANHLKEIFENLMKVMCEEDKTFIQHSSDVQLQDSAQATNTKEAQAVSLTDGIALVNTEYKKMEIALEDLSAQQAMYERYLSVSPLPTMECSGAAAMESIPVNDRMNVHWIQVRAEAKDVMNRINDTKSPISNIFKPVSQSLMVINDHTEALRQEEDNIPL